ncbi:MAG TPA: hypothetical protein VFG19_07750 [Geobacteraceae bacterium]|nr:hypothetical protein [Geobacteraceae bacterium]
MRYAIWLTEGEIVFVRYYDAGTNRAIIEHRDGRCELVLACNIRLLEERAYLKAGLSSR